MELRPDADPSGDAQVVNSRSLTEDLAFLLEDWHDGIDDDTCRRLIAVGLMADRSEALVTMESLPPAPSGAGMLLRQVILSHGRSSDI